MNKIEIVQKLYQAEQKQLTLTIDDFKEIIEDNRSNIAELFEFDINHNDGKISIVGDMIKFLREDDLINDANFRSLFLENSPLSEQPAYKMANRNELSPIAMAIALNKPKLVKFLLEKNPQLNFKTAIKHPDSELSPIGVAVTKNNPRMIELLIK
ncbi:MAG: hypothetical protein ACO201_01055 [Rickettsiales bacterium]